MKAVYLRLTEEINALDYLEKSYHFIEKANKDKYAWKWVVLSPLPINKLSGGIKYGPS